MAPHLTASGLASRVPAKTLGRDYSWFERGAAAFSAAFPDAPGIGPERGSLYLCPECIEGTDEGTLRVRLLTRSAVESRELTAEHVPPDSFGGRELLLTCRQHNSDAGSRLESDARHRENPVDALAGLLDHPAKVQMSAGQHDVRASLRVSGSELALEIPALKTHANDPRVLAAFWEALPALARAEGELRLSFLRDAYQPERANAMWLRHAYLAMFSIAGYRYALSRGLQIVREHVCKPERGLIKRFVALVPGQHDWNERRILRVREPEWLASWAVQFGRYLVFLPRAGDSDFYPRLEEKAVAGMEATIAGDQVAWPSEPLFGLEEGAK